MHAYPDSLFSEIKRLKKQAEKLEKDSMYQELNLEKLTVNIDVITHERDSSIKLTSPAHICKFIFEVLDNSFDLDFINVFNNLKPTLILETLSICKNFPVFQKIIALLFLNLYTKVSIEISDEVIRLVCQEFVFTYSADDFYLVLHPLFADAHDENKSSNNQEVQASKVNKIYNLIKWLLYKNDNNKNLIKDILKSIKIKNKDFFESFFSFALTKRQQKAERRLLNFLCCEEELRASPRNVAKSRQKDIAKSCIKIISKSFNKNFENDQKEKFFSFLKNSFSSDEKQLLTEGILEILVDEAKKGESFVKLNDIVKQLATEMEASKWDDSALVNILKISRSFVSEASKEKGQWGQIRDSLSILSDILCASEKFNGEDCQKKFLGLEENLKNCLLQIFLPIFFQEVKQSNFNLPEIFKTSKAMKTELTNFLKKQTLTRVQKARLLAKDSVIYKIINYDRSSNKVVPNQTTTSKELLKHFSLLDIDTTGNINDLFNDAIAKTDHEKVEFYLELIKDFSVNNNALDLLWEKIDQKDEANGRAAKVMALLLTHPKTYHSVLSYSTDILLKRKKSEFSEFVKSFVSQNFKSLESLLLLCIDKKNEVNFLQTLIFLKIADLKPEILAEAAFNKKIMPPYNSDEKKQRDFIKDFLVKHNKTIKEFSNTYGYEKIFIYLDNRFDMEIMSSRGERLANEIIAKIDDFNKPSDICIKTIFTHHLNLSKYRDCEKCDILSDLISVFEKNVKYIHFLTSYLILSVIPKIIKNSYSFSLNKIEERVINILNKDENYHLIIRQILEKMTKENYSQLKFDYFCEILFDNEININNLINSNILTRENLGIILKRCINFINGREKNYLLFISKIELFKFDLTNVLDEKETKKYLKTFMFYYPDIKKIILEMIIKIIKKRNEMQPNHYSNALKFYCLHFKLKKNQQNEREISEEFRSIFKTRYVSSGDFNLTLDVLTELKKLIDSKELFNLNTATWNLIDDKIHLLTRLKNLENSNSDTDLRVKTLYKCLDDCFEYYTQYNYAISYDDYHCLLERAKYQKFNFKIISEDLNEISPQLKKFFCFLLFGSGQFDLAQSLYGNDILSPEEFEGLFRHLVKNKLWNERYMTPFTKMTLTILEKNPDFLKNNTFDESLIAHINHNVLEETLPERKWQALLCIVSHPRYAILPQRIMLGLFEDDMFFKLMMHVLSEKLIPFDCDLTGINENTKNNLLEITSKLSEDFIKKQFTALYEALPEDDKQTLKKMILEKKDPYFAKLFKKDTSSNSTLNLIFVSKKEETLWSFVQKELQVKTGKEEKKKNSSYNPGFTGSLAPRPSKSEEPEEFQLHNQL